LQRLELPEGVRPAGSAIVSLALFQQHP
jgi:hypothetical protein